MAASKRIIEITRIGCPDCSGVLSQEKDGDGPHLQFICMVGHAYSLHSLLQAKEMQLEQVLWSAVSLLEQVALIDGLLLKHIDEHGFPTPPHGLLARIRQIQDHTAHVRRVIEETESPDLEPHTGDSNTDPA